MVTHPKRYLSMDKGEEHQAGEAHISREEVGTHTKKFAADIEQDHTTAKGICTVQI